MARKRIKLSKSMLFLWFTLATLILLFCPQKLTNKFQFAFARIFQWPLRISRAISLSAQPQKPLTQYVSRREYNKLQNHIANLTEWLQQEYEKVEKLTKLRNREILEGAKFVVADISASFRDGSNAKLIINRGRDDGIDKGQFIIGDNSIIGTISEVASRTAQVKLVTDPMSKIPIEIAGLDTARILQGNGSNSAGIQLLQTTCSINVGDYVYARKKPGFLDNPMVVGKITKFERDDEKPLLWDVTVEPACNIEKLNSVTVIIMNPATPEGGMNPQQ